MSRSNNLASLADNATGLETLTVSDITDLTATATELNYSDGVGSALQTQINTKAPIASPTFTGTVSGVTASHITSGTLGSSVVVPPSIGGTLIYISKAVSSGSTAIMEFTNLDNSYAFYKFILYRVYPASDNKTFYVSLGPTSSSDSTYLTGSSDYLNGSSQFTTNDDTYNNANGYLAWAYSVGNNYGNDSGVSGELNLWNCSDSSINTSASWSFIHSNQNQLPYGNVGVGNTNGTINPITKIKFHFQSGENFASGSTIVQYGVKHG